MLKVRTRSSFARCFTVIRSRVASAGASTNSRLVCAGLSATAVSNFPSVNAEAGAGCTSVTGIENTGPSSGLAASSASTRATCTEPSAPAGTGGASTSRLTVRAPLVRCTKSGAVIHGTLGFNTTSLSNAKRVAGPTDSAHAGVILTATRCRASVIASRNSSPRPLLVNVPRLTSRS